MLWGATIAVARVTHNVILLPTIVLLGSFLVPVTAVVWYLDHDPSPALSPRRILTAFIIGGTIGVLGASLLEYWLVGVGLLGTFEVGLIEEFVKGVFIVWSAILGGVIFAAARRGGLHLTWGILGTFLVVSVLHGAFDAINGIVGYVVVSLVGLVPFIWLWRRGDAGGVLPRRRAA